MPSMRGGALQGLVLWILVRLAAISAARGVRSWANMSTSMPTIFGHSLSVLAQAMMKTSVQQLRLTY